MKFLIIFACILIIARVNCMTAQEQKQMLAGIAQDCKASEGATDNDLSLLILKKPMTTKEGKCMFACILEQAGIMENAAVVESGLMEFISTSVNNEASKVSKAEGVVKKCKDLTAPERCEAAHKITECLKKGLKKEKIDIGL